ncbi:MAG: 30S ribosomal protein S6 [Candidatus Omnitrophota bacterium]
MENAKSYSGLFIIVPEKADSVEDVQKSISSIISENSGNIVKTNIMGKRTLAYPIKKKTEGIYCEVIFTAPAEAIASMTRLFQINTDLLRAVVTLKKEIS